jgi:hypothetical protein
MRIILQKKWWCQSPGIAAILHPRTGVENICFTRRDIAIHIRTHRDVKSNNPIVRGLSGKPNCT